MALQRWRAWQWVGVALLVGAVIGILVTRDASEDPTVPSMAVSQFMRRIESRTDAGNSIFTNILIEPARTGPSGAMIQKVTFREMRRHKTTGVWAPVADWWMAAPIPLYPRAQTPDYRVLDFLKEKAKEMPSLDYHYAWWQVSTLPQDHERKWWQTTGAMFGVVMGASVLVIGVLWPIVIRILVKLGFGDPDVEAAGIDLSKVSSRSNTSLVGAKSAASADDEARLTALNDELESNIGGMLIDTSQRDEEAEMREEEEAIRKLSNAPVEAVEGSKADDADKDFTGGEFYPVARPHVKKTD